MAGSQGLLRLLTCIQAGPKTAPLTLLGEISTKRCPKTVKFGTCSCILTSCNDESKVHVLHHV